MLCVYLCVKSCDLALGHVWNRQKDLSSVSITETNNKQKKLYNHLFIKNINNILLDIKKKCFVTKIDGEY